MVHRRMPRTLVGLGVALLCGSVVAACSGILDPEPTRVRHYVLTPLPAVVEAPLVDPSPTVGLAGVTLAKHLDHPGIATRMGPNQLTLAEFDQWAAPLDQHVAVVLAENLTVQIPTEGVRPLPASRAVDLDYRVETNVIAFEWRIDGEVVLTAHWSVLDAGATRELAFGRSTYRQPLVVPVIVEEDGTKSLPPDSYRAIVAAMSEALAELGADIAAAVRAAHARRDDASPDRLRLPPLPPRS